MLVHKVSLRSIALGYEMSVGDVALRLHLPPESGDIVFTADIGEIQAIRRYPLWRLSEPRNIDLECMSVKLVLTPRSEVAMYIEAPRHMAIQTP